MSNKKATENLIVLDDDHVQQLLSHLNKFSDENGQDRGDIPTNKIIDEVVDSCKNLDIDKERDTSKVGDETSNKACFQPNCPKTATSKVVEEDFIDDVYLKDLDVSSSPEELEERKKLAIEGKDLGNNLFKNGDYEGARKEYTKALRLCPLQFNEERAMLFGNRAAAKIKQNMKNEAIEDCTKALELNPKYVKALIRRAKLYEETEKLNESLEDYKKILELDSGNSEARAATMRLPAEINEQNERLKTEMLGSLKELGNKLLKPFGLSTDNFQVQQDPNSGGYSINFKQNRK